MSTLASLRGGTAIDRSVAPNRSRITGIAVMVGLHLLLGYALFTGLAHKAVKWVQKPVTAAIIPEELPPPPPPPKIERLVEQVKTQQAPPPPTYVPPPDTPAVTAAPPAPTITAVQHTEPVAPPAPTPPAPSSPTASAKTDIGVACPNYGQTLQSALEGLYDKVGIAGTVKVQFKVLGNTVLDTAILSGPREYHRAVLAAVRRFSCKAAPGAEPVVTFDVIFRAD